jgi:hypothetical protein
MRANRIIHDDSQRTKRDRAFLSELQDTTKTIVIRLQRNGLRGDALADAVAETVAICWETFSKSNRTIHSAIGYAIAEKRTELRERRKAQTELALELWPDTMADRVAWEYPDGEIAVVPAYVPAIPLETPETRKRRFVRPSDWKTLPRLKAVHLGDMEAAEEIDAMDAADRFAADAAWIGCRHCDLLTAIERSLDAAME